MDLGLIFEFWRIDNPYKQIGSVSVCLIQTELIRIKYVSILIVQEYSCGRKYTHIICRCYGIYNLSFQLENRSLLDLTS